MDLRAVGLLDRLSSTRVLVVGDAILDRYVRGSVTGMCREAPVPVFRPSVAVDVAGGAANTALNCSALGTEVKFVTVLGDCEAGRSLWAALAGQRVDLRHVLLSRARKTIIKTRFSIDGQILFRTDSGDTGRADREDEGRLRETLCELWSDCDVVLISDYGYGVLGSAIVGIIEGLQRESPKFLAVDSRNLARFRTLSPMLVKPNYEEALALLGSPPPGTDRVGTIRRNSERILVASGANVAAVTLDRDGAVVAQRGRDPFQTPAHPQPDARTVGAGDTYFSAFALALASGADARVAAEMAARASEVVLEKRETATCSKGELAGKIVGSEKVFSSIQDLRACSQAYRAHQKRVVFTNGCFDIIHRGHVEFLDQARRLGDVLIVAVNSDASIQRLRGPGRPINCLTDRVEVLAALESVSHIAVFDEDRPVDILEAVRPDLFVKGGDYRPDMLPERSLVESLGGRVEILPYIEHVSTSGLIHRIATAPGASD